MGEEGPELIDVRGRAFVAAGATAAICGVLLGEHDLAIDDIAASVDIEGIVQRIDLGGIIRESTASLTMETVDAVRDFCKTLVRLLRISGRPQAGYRIPAGPS